MSEWTYTIRVGHGRISDAHDAVAVFQIVDPDGEELAAGSGDDLGDVLMKATSAILQVEDAAS